MPCRSDYLEQTAEEKNNQLAAQLLVYVFNAQAKPIPAWVQRESETYYAHDSRSVPLLCSVVKGMTDKVRAAIVYDGSNPTARKLADWWDLHEQMDKEKQRRSRQAKRDAKLREDALAKLNPAERRALGV